MKTNIIALIVILLLGCKESSSRKQESEKCNLKALNDSSGAGFNDFTIHSVDQYEKDVEGTDWKHQTNDSYRFVFSIGFDNKLLVYKNGNLFQKFTNLKEKSTRNVPVDYTKCELDWLKERVVTSWYIEKHVTSQSADRVERLMNGLPKREELLNLYWHKSDCRCSIWFYINNKTKVFGTFNVAEQNGQVCP